MIKKIGFVRHGETNANKTGIVQGWDQCGLNDNGVKQVKNTAIELIGQKWDLIISSDLIRTKQSAEIIGEVLNIPIFYSELLREKRPDSNVIGRTMEELENGIEESGDGESIMAFFRRVRHANKIMMSMLAVENILVVSHEKFICYAIKSLVKKEYKTIPNGCVIIIDRRKDNDIFYI